MTFFSVEHTFIICCGNKCSFIDYKIKVSSLGIFLCESVSVYVSLSGDYSVVVRDDYYSARVVVTHCSVLILYLMHVYFCPCFFFFRLFFLSCILWTPIWRWFEKRASKHSNKTHWLRQLTECCAYVHFISYIPWCEMYFVRVTVHVCVCMYSVCNPYRLQFQNNSCDVSHCSKNFSR